MKGKITKVNLFAAVLAAAMLVACTPGPSGTYSDPSGAFVLTLNSGGKATFAFGGDAAMCTYTSDTKTVSLTCPGQAGALVLTVQGDGSLTGPPGTFMPPLKKK